MSDQLPVLREPATAMKLGGVMLMFAPSLIVTGEACAQADRMSTQTNRLSSRFCADRHGIEYEAMLQPTRGWPASIRLVWIVRLLAGRDCPEIVIATIPPSRTSC